MLSRKSFTVAVLLFLLVAVSAFATGQQIDCLLSGIRYPSSDTPLSGGLVYTYSAGTLVAKSTWTDAAKTTLQTNPIVLDTYGRALAFGDGKYKFVVKSSVGATLFTWDALEYSSVGTLASDSSNPHGTTTTFTTVTIASLTATLTANLNGNDYKVTMLATGAANQDAVNVGQMNATLTAAVASFTGSLASATGDIASLTASMTLVIASLTEVIGTPSRQIFVASGTWTCPAGITTVFVTGAGGGGAGCVGSDTGTYGGGGGGGGSGDATRSSAITVVPGTAYTITIGVGSSLPYPSVGSSTIMASGASALITLVGGSSATPGGASPEGVGGASGGSGGTAGENGFFAEGTIRRVRGGQGGGNIAGGVGGTSESTGLDGIFGGGGGGGTATNGGGGTAGGAGGNGFILLEW